MKTIHSSQALLKKFLIVLVMASCTLAGAAHANGGCPSCGASQASELSVAGSGIVVLGSMSMLAGSGQVVINSVEAVADGVVVVLKGASEAATVSVKLTGKAAKSASVVAGTAVQIVAVTTGSLLVASGQAIAFIPNEIGSALLHQSKVQSGK